MTLKDPDDPDIDAQYGKVLSAQTQPMTFLFILSEKCDILRLRFSVKMHFDNIS